MNKKQDNTLVIYQKYIDLIYYSNDILKKHPKSEKFALVQELKQTMYAGLRSLIFAQKEFNKKDKLKYLNELDVNMVLLKLHIRLSYKFKYITIQNYNAWSTKITDVCNMLGAWIMSCLKKQKIVFIKN